MAPVHRQKRDEDDHPDAFASKVGVVAEGTSWAIGGEAGDAGNHRAQLTRSRQWKPTCSHKNRPRDDQPTTDDTRKETRWVNDNHLKKNKGIANKLDGRAGGSTRPPGRDAHAAGERDVLLVPSHGT